MNNKKFSITKRIAKHGSQAIIVIPRVLEQKLKPGTIVELKINILEKEHHPSVVGVEEEK
ncbi:MAG: hypothetical protein KKB31_04695 [Nanoarchaeota archaeon]|nr:hypothetical protein [Nanoarchaeota archaeon]